VGVAIAVLVGSTWKINTFLLSCRAIGRQVETTLLSTLIYEIRKRGGKRILGEYLPTPKNIPASTFYHDQGFEKISDTLWEWEVLDGDM